MYKTVPVGTSLAIQWLRLQASTAGGVGSIPGLGTKLLHAAWHSQRKKKKPTTTVLVEVRIVVTLDRGQYMGDASGALGMFPFLIWVLVKVCLFWFVKSVKNVSSCKLKFLKNVSSCKLTIHILCVSTYFPGLCTAESVHTEGRNWKGKYPRSQAGFPYLPRMSRILWREPH